MQQQLGRRLSFHKGLFTAGGWLWYIGGILVLSFFANLVKGEIVLAFASLGCGLLCLIAPVLKWRQSLAVFEHGFVWQRLTGARSVRKEEVAQATMTTHTSRAGSYVEVEILLSDDRELSVVGVSEPEQLFNTLNAWTARAAAQSDTGGTPVEQTGRGWTPPSQRDAE